ncbi:hypothetical protein ASD64_06425 [Mesorhizobium sp. Root157]|uniref:hypothetical protein n=1 Tax=Mesorhizobium sp. Root157 TaxID=1736477 RepID=UPI0006F47082|nr:hypothetical protein [Mesorhizobium sp. Root157]KQZ87081.1 hypothetical protein ASD64_06425 [Mesorhizobium sp. Root157]
MKATQALPIAIAFTVLSSFPAFALSSWFPHHGNGGGSGGNNGGGQVSHSAPGPVIGLGIPAVVALGGYLWVRNRNRKSKDGK